MNFPGVALRRVSYNLSLCHGHVTLEAAHFNGASGACG